MKTLLLLSIPLVLAFSASASSSLDEEVAHLLETVSQSGCSFVRNGAAHAAQDARAHMELKYGRIKRRVKTTEQFIEYVATRSSMTGRRYTMRCEGSELPTGEWLTSELGQYRASRGEPKTRP